LTSGGPRLPEPRSRRNGRILDIAAAVIVAIALWRFLIAPNLLSKAVQRAPQVVATGTAGPILLGGPAGRVRFVDFWATWCEPCRLSLPLVESFARAHPDVDVLAVDVGEQPVVAQKYAHEHGIGGLAFDESGRAAAAYGVSGYPTMIVIDPKGFVRARWVGFNPAIGIAMANARAALGTAR
jgi:thiol-disulfide isomerase/thioredoxin